jgi:hypothetical protein
MPNDNPEKRRILPVQTIPSLLYTTPGDNQQPDFRDKEVE